VNGDFINRNNVRRLVYAFSSMSQVSPKLRIATRESRLAMAQTEMVREALRARDPRLQVEIVGMTTKGDRVLDRPLAQVGGKGLFVKELEVALDEGRADIAVHSLKDVPMELPPQFSLVTFGDRELPLDAFVSNAYASLDSIPANGVVGTSSLRRECQLRRAYPHLQFRGLRGNVNTRLAKLDAGDYDAIILAAAGLRRLGLDGRIRGTLAEQVSLPAIGQGILGVEFRRERADLAALFAGFEDPPTAAAARAERAFGRVVEGSCEVPVGAYARVHDGEVKIEGFVGMPDGSSLVRLHAQGGVEDAEAVGRALGDRILAAGGREILGRLLQKSA
jgi:hydroxymethylbilane synthase